MGLRIAALRAMWVSAVFVGVVSAALVGCNGDSDPTAAGSGSNLSCAVSSSGIDTCVDYTGAGYVSAASIESGCEQSLGTFSELPCRTENRVGTCTYNSGLSTEFKTRYYTPSLTVEAAEAACPIGEFTAG